MAHGRSRAILKAGATAPDFRLRNLAGGETGLKELLPQAPLLLAFFKVSCPVCQLTFPFLERIHNEKRAGALTIYGIAQDEAEWTREFTARFGVTFPTLLDTQANGYEASNAFGISTVPTMFLVERDGTISKVIEGFSRLDVQELGALAGVNPFRPGEHVPEWKAG
jgi:peroxiredoxin